MLEQVIENHDEVARDGVLAVDAQVFDLVDQIGDVELLQPARPEEPNLLLVPLAVIAFVKRLSLLVDRVRTRY